MRRALLELTQVEPSSAHLIHSHHITSVSGATAPHDHPSPQQISYSGVDEDENEVRVVSNPRHTTTHTQHVQQTTPTGRRLSQSQTQSQSKSSSPAMAPIAVFSPRQNPASTQQQNQGYPSEPSPRLRTFNHTHNPSHGLSHHTSSASQHRSSSTYYSRQNGSGNGHLNSPPPPHPPTSVTTSSAGSTSMSTLSSAVSTTAVNGVKGRNNNIGVTHSSSASSTSSAGSIRADPPEGTNSGGPRKRLRRSRSPAPASSSAYVHSPGSGSTGYSGERYGQVKGGSYERQYQQQQYSPSSRHEHAFAYERGQTKQGVTSPYQSRSERERGQFIAQSPGQGHVSSVRGDIYRERERDGYVSGRSDVYAQKQQQTRRISPYGLSHNHGHFSYGIANGHGRDRSRSGSGSRDEGSPLQDELIDDIEDADVSGAGVVVGDEKMREDRDDDDAGRDNDNVVREGEEKKYQRRTDGKPKMKVEGGDENLNAKRERGRVGEVEDN